MIEDAKALIRPIWRSPITGFVMAGLFLVLGAYWIFKGWAGLAFVCGCGFASSYVCGLLLKTALEGQAEVKLIRAGYEEFKKLQGQPGQVAFTGDLEDIAGRDVRRQSWRAGDIHCRRSYGERSGSVPRWHARIASEYYWRNIRRATRGPRAFGGNLTIKNATIIQPQMRSAIFGHQIKSLSKEIP